MGSDFTFVQRHHVLSHPTYWFEIDEYRRGSDQFLLAHLRVASWSPSVLKRIIRDFRVFRQHVTAPLYACGEVDDTRFEKFAAVLGYEYLHDTICENGHTRRLFIHVHKDANERFIRNQTRGNDL